MSQLQRMFRVLCNVHYSVFFLVTFSLTSSSSRAQESAAEQPSTAENAPVENAPVENAPVENAQPSADVVEGWFAPWVTSLTSLAGDEQFASTAQGLLLRESAVVRYSASQPHTATTLYTHPSSVWAIAANDQVVCSTDYRGNLGVWSRQENRVTLHEGVLERWTRALAFAPDPDQLVAANESGKLFVWSISQGAALRDVQLEPQQVNRLVFSPGGDQIAVINGAGQLQLLAWPGLDIQQTIKIGEQPLLAVSYSDNGAQLIVAGADRKIWRVQSVGEPQSTEIATVSDWVTAMDRLASGGGWMLGCMNGKIHTLTGDTLEEVAVAPSGIWDLKVGGGDVVLMGTRKHAVVTLKRSWALLHAAEPKVLGPPAP